MAKPTGTMAVKDLLDMGALQPGEKIILQRLSKPSINGVVEADGSITVQGRTFGTPSPAACYALGLTAVDGWIRWRVPRLGNKHFAEIRTELQGQGDSRDGSTSG